MSALALALAAFDARSQSNQEQTATQGDENQLLAQPSVTDPISPSSCYSSLPSLINSATTSTSEVNICPPLKPTHSTARPNEHLAVLLPKHLWKPDSLASRCDNFYCRVRFSIFERRHHCRKCGGVFCNPCSSRTTPLLDTSNLDFIHPPRNVPLSNFESSDSPILPSRVCNDCWEQLHRPLSIRTSTPDLIPASRPICLQEPLSSSSSSMVSSVATPPNCASPLSARRSLRTMPSISSLNNTKRLQLRISHAPLPDVVAEQYGPFEAYPLKHSSTICKLTGGGRWEPKLSPPAPGYRIPGGKALFEVEMEREEEEERIRRSNPVVRDGEFQYRFPREVEPLVMARSPFQLSTF